MLEADNTFEPGTFANLELTVSADGREDVVLPYRLFVDSPYHRYLLRESFQKAKPGQLPTGWTNVHAAGGLPAWGATTYCGTKGAYHSNDTDFGAGWERLLSPVFKVPDDAEYVTVEFDICYLTEDDPGFDSGGQGVWAWDGLFLRLTDFGTPAAPGVIRSVLAEAFADGFWTGDDEHYPKHLPRSSDPAYFQDMSVWAGWSGGVRHVKMRFPGMAGRLAQLRFEYTQDGFADCNDAFGDDDLVCGVVIDNVLVTTRDIKSPTSKKRSETPTK